MIPLTGTVFIALLTTALLHWFVHRRSLRRFAREHNCLPPPRYPHGILGLKFLYGLYIEDKEQRVLRTSHQRFEVHGHTWYNSSMGVTDIVTREPENIKAILATQFQEFDLGTTRWEIFYPLLGNGIFTLSQGKGWEHSRALLRPQFNRTQIINDLDSQDFHVNRFLDLLPRNEVFDLQPFFFRLTLDTATDFLFGESVESLLEPGEDTPGGAFAEAFNTALYWLAQRMRAPRLAPLLGRKYFPKSCNTARHYVDRFLDKAFDQDLKAAREEKEKGEGRQKKYVFLEALAEVTNDRKMITDQLMNILLAGRDTTAGLLSITIWLLARNKDVWVKLREGILNVIGPTEKPTWEKIKDMKYLRNVLNESLRLFPIVPQNARAARVRTTIPRGGGPDGSHPVMVEAGQKVIYSTSSMQRRKDIYGTDADEFKPDRWNTLRTGWEYIPFNGGPRVCLGQQFALMEASFVLVRLGQRFVDLFGVDPRTGLEVDGFSGVRTTDEFREGLTLTLMVGDGVHVRLVPAEG